MPSHNRVTPRPISADWPRCTNVEVTGDRLVCVLDWSRKYDLTNSYRYRPHIDFLNLDQNEQELAAFLRLRGPLWGVYWKGQPKKEAEGSKAAYWAFHRGLKADLRLVRTFTSREKSDLKEAILECAAADEEKALVADRARRLLQTTGLEELAFGLSLDDEGPKPEYVNTISDQERAADQPSMDPRKAGLEKLVPGLTLEDSDPAFDFKKWLALAGISTLRSIAGWRIESGFSVAYGLSAVWRQGHGGEISWRPSVSTLAEAMQWMFWHDIAGKCPLTFCAECGVAFLPDSGHARIYCSYACGHRVAVRNWRRRR